MFKIGIKWGMTVLCIENLFASHFANHNAKMHIQIRYEISGPLEYHIQRFPSSLYVAPFIFKPIFVRLPNENAAENWLENNRTTYRAEGTI